MRVVLYLRRTHREALGLDEFLCLGLIGLSYGIALLIGTYAFLAVFAAGLAVRRIERTAAEEQDGGPPGDEAEDPAFVASELLAFNERLERIGEVGVVIVIGALVSTTPFPRELFWFAPLLFLAIRPVAVLVGLVRAGSDRRFLGYVSWFGIRGIGSLYYLSYAIVHGVVGADAERLVGLTLWIVAISIVVHGVSVTPLMQRYEAMRGSRRAPSARGARDVRRVERAE